MIIYQKHVHLMNMTGGPENLFQTEALPGKANLINKSQIMNRGEPIKKMLFCSLEKDYRVSNIGV